MDRRLPILVVVLLLSLAAVPGVVAAETRTGGSVVVEAGETVDEDLQAFSGTIVVRGTVDGDLQAFGGTVVVTGTVTGDVQAAAGTVQILGTVGGNVEASAGSVDVGESAQIDGTFSAAGGSVTVAGTVGGDARLAGDIALADTATLGGDLRWDGELDRASGASVAGTVTRDRGLSTGMGGEFALPQGVFAVYGTVVALLLGAVLLAAFPVFSRQVATDATTEPLRTAGIGFGALVAVPVALTIVAITVIGIPLSLAGAVAFGLLIWVGTVYGRYALGAWLLSLGDYENRWLALLVGVVLVALLAPVPVLDPLVRLAVFLLGFGALVRGLWRAYRSRRETRGRGQVSPDAGPVGPTTGSETGSDAP